MKKTKEFATASECQDAFYQAFSQCQPEAMATIWHEHEPVCIHPGSAPLTTLTSILESWQSILDNSVPPNLHITLLSHNQTSNMEVFVVNEQIISEHDGNIITATVIATNIFQKTNRGWKMTVHHGSTTSIVRSPESSNTRALH